MLECTSYHDLEWPARVRNMLVEIRRRSYNGKPRNPYSVPILIKSIDMDAKTYIHILQNKACSLSLPVRSYLFKRHRYALNSYGSDFDMIADAPGRWFRMKFIQLGKHNNSRISLNTRFNHLFAVSVPRHKMQYFYGTLSQLVSALSRYTAYAWDGIAAIDVQRVVIREDNAHTD